MTHSFTRCFALILLALANTSNFSYASSYYKNRAIYVGGVSQKVSWEAVKNNVLPQNAFIGATTEKGPVYICQARFNTGVYPGQLIENKCVITHNGKVIPVDDYQILVSKEPLKWEEMNSLYRYYSRRSMGVIAKNSLQVTGINVKAKAEPLIGGFEFKNRYYPQSLFICRTMSGTRIHVGKMESNKCLIAAENQETHSTMFQILAIQKKLDKLD